MTPGKRLGVESSPVQEPRVLSTLPDATQLVRACAGPGWPALPAQLICPVSR